LNIQLKNTPFALALSVLLSCAGQAQASSGYWDIFFVAPPQVVTGTREAWVLRGSTYPLNLQSQQTEYCLTELPSGGNGSCPSSVGLMFELTPSGTDPCFVRSNGSCGDTGATLSPGGSAGIELEVFPTAPLQSSVLRVRASSGADVDIASLTVKVVPDLFAPPPSLKLFRGDVATTVALPLSRPAGLNKPIDVFIATADLGASLAGLSTGFSPATLSPNASSTTMSLAATSSAELGTRSLAVGAMVFGPTVEPTALMHPFELVIADAITPIFPSRILMSPGTTKTIQVDATVDPDATSAPPTFTLTGCNCSEMKSQIALNGSALLVQTSPIAPVGTLQIGVRATAGTFTRDFVVKIKVTAP
jgi:hypothetical protein